MARKYIEFKVLHDANHDGHNNFQNWFKYVYLKPSLKEGAIKSCLDKHLC